MIRTLDHPWSSWDDDTSTAWTSNTVTLDAHHSAVISLPGGAGLAGHRQVDLLSPRGRVVDAEGLERVLWDVAAPSRRVMEEGVPVDVRLRGDAAERRTVRTQNAVIRPVPGKPAEAVAYVLDGLVALQVDRVETLVRRGEERKSETGAMNGLVRPRWDDVADVMLDAEDTAEPTMALIARHAETLRHAVRDLAEHPRKVLRRERHREPIARITELDAACLQWYVRQPGKTPTEKAGPSQRLMAVVRNETYDTLENRVLKDFLERSHRAANAYRQANAALKDSNRHAAVRRYGSMVRDLSRRPGLDDVPPVRTVPAPNYVLLRDRRYARMWKAYLDLVHREDVLDEAWSWQRNLWRDVAALMTSTAPMTLPGVEAHLALPLYLRTEQAFGRWISNGDLAKTLLWSERRDAVVVVRRPTRTDSSPRERPFGSIERHLQADLRVDVHVVGGARRATGLTWALHSVATDEIDLHAAAASADRALSRWAKTSGQAAPSGLILVLGHDPYGAPRFAHHGHVDAISVPLAGDGLAKTIDSVTHWYDQLVSQVAA